MAERKPFIPPKYDKADVLAMQALARGEASDFQQQRALNYIIHQICGTYDLPYHESQRDTDFALGKTFVGQQIVKLVNMDAVKAFPQES